MRRSMSADSALPKVGHLEFVGEHMVNDGGSHIFDFRAGTYGWIGVMVRHRSAEFGASSGFQEIRLWRREQEYLVLEAQSQSEQHLLRLLGSASINTNRWSGTPSRPSDERLRWLINRIQNRKSQW